MKPGTTTANHTATSWGTGPPSTKQGKLGNRTRFTGFRQSIILLNSKKTRVSTCKRVYFQKFLQSLGSVVAAAPMFLLVLALFCRSTCQFRGNSEKSNHLLSATSHIELEFLTKFLKMSKLPNCCTRGSRYSISQGSTNFRGLLSRDQTAMNQLARV